jgi:hypothetical protein
MTHAEAQSDTTVGRAPRLSSVARRLFALGACALMLFAAVTLTLPGPLARISPDIAMYLNGRHPDVLVAKALKLREKLQTALDQERDEKASGSDAGAKVAVSGASVASQTASTDEARQFRRSRIDRSSPDAGGGRFAVPLQLSKRTASGEIADLRTEIATIAQRALDAAPMNTKALRLLAEVTDDRDTVRRLMTRAARFNPRETLALVWLHADAVDRKDLPVLVDMADKVMRTRPELIAALAPQSTLAVSTPEGRSHLIKRMAEDPPWRRDFLRLVVNDLEEPSQVLALLSALMSTQTPPTVDEVRLYISEMLNREKIDLAYEAWRLLVPRGDTSSRGQLHNASFDRTFTGYPFDWVAPKANGAEVGQLEMEFSRRALRVLFDGNRVKSFSVRQIVLLAPGKYRLNGRFRGFLAANRGLRWQVRCVYGTRETLGQSELLARSEGDWAAFDFQFNVIEVDECKAQMVVLIHDARSASEEVVSGEIQFDEFSLTPEPASDVPNNPAERAPVSQATSKAAKP